MGSVVIIPPTILIMEVFRRTMRRKQKPKPTEPETAYDQERPITSPEIDFDIDRYTTKECLTVKSPEDEIEELFALMNAKVRKEDMASKNQKGPATKDKSFSLKFPWWFVFVGYFLVFASVFLGAFFCLFYSLDWGKEKSHQWLLSIFLCSAQNIIIMQPIKVFILALFFACIMRLPDQTGDDLSSDELRHKNTCNGTTLATMKVPLPTYVPGQVELEKSKQRRSRARQEDQKDVRLFTHLREFGLQLATVLLILVINYANRDSLTYRQNQTIKDGLSLQREQSGDQSIMVREFHSAWTWFEDVLVPFAFPSRDYTGASLSLYDTKFTANDNGYRMTELRLRQIRVKIDATEKRLIRDIVPRFRHRHSEESRDKRHFGLGWKTELRNLTGIPLTPFIYQEDNSEMATNVKGQFSSYENGGYIADLGHDSLQATRVLSYLRRNSWIDKHAAALIAEINLFNANLNLMSIVQVLIEIPTTTGLYCQVLVHTFRPYPYVDVWDFVFLLIQIAWACYIIFLVTRAAAKCIKQKTQFFKEAWNLIDCLLISLSMLALSFFVVRSLTIVAVMEEIMNKKGKYVSTGSLKVWDEAYSYTLAASLFVATLSLFRPMIFSETLARLKYVLTNSSRAIAEFAFIFVLFLFAFGTSIVIALGSVSEEFSTISSAMTTQFAMMLIGFRDFHGGNVDEAAISKVLLFFFHLCSQILFMNMFVSFMYNAVSYVQSNEHLVAQNKELSEHVWHKFEKWIGHLIGKEGKQKENIKERKELRADTFFELYSM